MYFYIGLGIAAYVAGKYRTIWLLQQILEGLYRAHRKNIGSGEIAPEGRSGYPCAAPNGVVRKLHGWGMHGVPPNNGGLGALLGGTKNRSNVE